MEPVFPSLSQVSRTRLQQVTVAALVEKRVVLAYILHKYYI